MRKLNIPILCEVRGHYTLVYGLILLLRRLPRFRSKGFRRFAEVIPRVQRVRRRPAEVWTPSVLIFCGVYPIKADY